MGIDLTPGFNLHRSAGGGIPFISKGNGSLGYDPSKQISQGTINNQKSADAYWLNQIAQKNTGNAGQQTTTYEGPSAPGYTMGVDDPATLARNKQAIGIAQSAVGRLPGQLDTALNQVRHSYDQNLNELNSGKQSANQNYNQSTNQNGQQFVTNKNQIADQASSGLRSLLAILAQHGAGGSAAAMYAAPDAVGQVASQQRAGAGQTFGENQASLDTNWNNYLSGYDNSKRKLSDWLGQQQNSARSTSEQQRQALLEQIAGLQQTPADAQRYIDQINASANRVDQLAKFNPSYTGATPVYNAPDVSSYTVDQVGNPVLGQQGNNTSAATPALSFLLGLNKDQQQQNQFAL